MSTKTGDRVTVSSSGRITDNESEMVNGHLLELWNTFCSHWNTRKVKE